VTRHDRPVGEDHRTGLLRDALDFAVPMAMACLAAMSESVRDWTRGQWAATAASLVAHQGDALLYPTPARRASRRAGVRVEASAGTVWVFAALARGLAAGAWQPGGVTFLGRHWCVDHTACLAAAAEAEAAGRDARGGAA
jgi:hypothetical protein